MLDHRKPGTIRSKRDWREIPYGTSRQVDWSVGSESTDDTLDSNEPPMLELLCHAEIGKLMEALADEMVLAMVALSCRSALDILCDESETQKCVDVATFDLSQDGTDMTSDGERPHLESRPGCRRLRVSYWKSPKLFGGFVCGGWFPKCCEP